MKKLTLEEYIKLGEKVQELYNSTITLSDMLSGNISKKVWMRGYDKLYKGFVTLKSDFDDQIFKDYPEHASEGLTHVFYCNQSKVTVNKETGKIEVDRNFERK